MPCILLFIPDFKKKSNIAGQYDLPLSGSELVTHLNPVSDFINLKFTRQPSARRVVLIYSMPGVLTLQSRAEKESIRITAGHFHPGLYGIRIVSGTGIYTATFIKVGNK
jgi:hypothetical protein